MVKNAGEYMKDHIFELRRKDMNMMKTGLIITAGLEIKKILQSPFGDQMVKNSRQVQIFSRQIKETQSVGIHDVLNAQGFARHYRAILSG